MAPGFYPPASRIYGGFCEGFLGGWDSERYCIGAYRFGKKCTYMGSERFVVCMLRDLAGCVRIVADWRLFTD